MAVPTRQATPGPSNVVSTTLQPQIQSGNTKKRSGSDAHEDSRDSKKIKIDGEAPSHLSSVNGKVKKKKKKKKKRRTSAVTAEPEKRDNSRSKLRSAPLSSNKQRSIPSHELVQSGVAANGTNVDEEDEPVLSSSDKGKGKAKSESPPQRVSALPSHALQPVASGSGPSSMITPHPNSTTQAAEIASLKEQLSVQGKLLERHQTHLVNHQQSLTCQICLDLMHKPYALAPCGHITCYGCLVRWFTTAHTPEIPGMANNGNAPPATENDSLETVIDSAQARNGLFVRRRKKCPVCRAVVIDRPIEMWSIKSMVSAFVRSGLGDLPLPTQPAAPAADEGANVDPWRNLFHKARSGHGRFFGGVMDAFFPPPPHPRPAEQADGDREQMGWYDVEDGGIYRCVDCYHEIWDGVCSACRRHYPGHGEHDDDDDDDDMSDLPPHHPLFRAQLMAEFTEDEDDDENVEEPHIWPRPDRHDRLRMMEEHIWDEEDLSDSEDDEDEELLHYHPYLPQHPLVQFYAEYGLQPPGARHRRAEGIARIDEVGDYEEEEESDYEGSFIDDEQEEDHAEDDDEVEVLDGPIMRPRNENLLRLRVLADDDQDEGPDRLRRQAIIDEGGGRRAILSSDEDEDESEDLRVLARQLGRGTRSGSRRVAVRRVAESESDGSLLEMAGDGDDDDDDIPPRRRRVERSSSPDGERDE